MKTILAALAATLLATGASADLMKPAAPVVVRGTITAVEPGGALSVKSNDGAALTVVLAPGAKVAALTKIGLDDIKANSFIGTAAKPGKNGVLEATEVHVFAESMRGLGEGHRAWDQGPTSTMTNGNVGKVGTIRHHSGRTLTVDYKGGTQEVVVPATTPIVAFAEGNAAQLVPGAHIFAFTMRTPDGKLATNQVAVGVGGVVPPM
ncbi:MAG: hypothetical protein ACRYG4_28810 [Janthinobacterium lividum]